MRKCSNRVKNVWLILKYVGIRKEAFTNENVEYWKAIDVALSRKVARFLVKWYTKNLTG